MRQPVRRQSPLLLSLLAALLAASGCASDGGGDSDDSAATSEQAPHETPADAPDFDEGEFERSVSDTAASVDSVELSGELEASEPKIIAKGNISLRSDDVSTAVFRVGEIADQYAGEVTERETTTNKDGEISTARLLLRIPVADFDKAFVDLQEDVADLHSSSTGKEDVTTKVIDTQVRIRAQRRSLSRVEALLDRAQSISDIIRIEGHLTRRQAALESLERRLAYLTDQTSMSTVSVNISLPPKEKESEKEEPEEAGFLAGLEDGWQALKSFGTDVATVTGQVLPFAGVLLLVGAPLLLVIRRFRRSDGDSTIAAPADA